MKDEAEAKTRGASVAISAKEIEPEDSNKHGKVFSAQAASGEQKKNSESDPTPVSYDLFSGSQRCPFTFQFCLITASC